MLGPRKLGSIMNTLVLRIKPEFCDQGRWAEWILKATDTSVTVSNAIISDPQLLGFKIQYIDFAVSVF